MIQIKLLHKMKKSAKKLLRISNKNFSTTNTNVIHGKYQWPWVAGSNQIFITELVIPTIEKTTNGYPPQSLDKNMNWTKNIVNL